MRSGRDWSGGSGAGSCYIENRKGCRGEAIPKVFVLDGEKPKAVENGRGSSMGWLIACEQARFFLRLSFLAFPPPVIFPSTVRSPAMPPSILSQVVLPFTPHSLLHPATHVEILSPNYTFIPPCIFATFLQAVNAPDYITMHEYRKCMAVGSVRFTAMYIMLVRLQFMRRKSRMSRSRMMIGRIIIGLKGCRDVMISGYPDRERFRRSRKSYLRAIMISEREDARDVVFEKNNDSNNPDRQAGFPPSRL